MTARMSDENVSIFSGILFSLPGALWLWPLQIDSLDPSSLMWVWFIKIMGTAILGIIGGGAGLLGKDLYKRIKNRITNKLRKSDKQDKMGDS